MVIYLETTEKECFRKEVWVPHSKVKISLKLCNNLETVQNIPHFSVSSIILYY